MLKLAKKMNKWSIAAAVVFMIIQVLGDLILPTLTADIIDNGVANGDVDYILNVGLKMIFMSLIAIAGAVANVFVAARESQGLGKKIRNEVFRKVTHFSNDELDEVGTASLITRTTNDVVQVQMVVLMMLRLMIMAPIMMVGAGFFAFTREPQLARAFLISIPLLAVLIAVIMHFAVPYFKSMQRKTDKLNLVFREGLTGVRVVRAFRKDKHEQNRFDEANKDYADTAIKAFTYMAFLMPAMTVVVSITNIMIIWFGGDLISTGQMEVGNLVTFMTYAMQILISVMQVAFIFMFIPRGQVSAARINEVLELKSTIKDPSAAKSVAEQKEISFEFDHVSFRYTGAEKSALEDIDFKVEKGETIAIIGGTGSGKSTLANLIPRFYDVESGSIKINGTDIRDFTQHDLRTLMGYAPQKAVLFTGTIRENMQYGKPEATDEEIWHALEIAQAKDFVGKMPKGLDAQVEQGGGNFSGGQRQRLSIARALVSKADILLFDDSFSALDFKTDAVLRAALKKETIESVVIIIAQRISSVVDADLIIVLDEGKMVGKGTHEQLKETNPTYQEIMESQMRGEDI
ncbi:ABC transporter ATP-binding protein [Desemzia sp. FAM 23991]|uniref:ABC transporter ATP-binding protein n=1 Tax=unclassified Desemzia TaxID=2685243 RepID=UPI00388B18FC